MNTETPERLSTALGALRPVPGVSWRARLTTIAPALSAFGDPSSDVRRGALERLSESSAFHPRMLEVALELAGRRVAPEAIARSIEAGHPRARGAHPRRTAIIAAGNVPGLSLLDAALSVVLGDPIALKSASGEPVTAALLVEDLARNRPPPAAVFNWRGGDEARERVLFAWADQLLAFGSDATIAAMTERVGSLRAGGARPAFSGFGHRLSCALVPAVGFGVEESAWRVAVDVSLHDQDGCLSPHVVFVERPRDARGFALHLSRALARLADALPPRARSLAERAAWREVLDDAEARRMGDAAIETWSDDGGRYAVVLDPSGPLTPSPLGRSVRVRPVGGPSDLLDKLRIFEGKLQALGVSADPGDHAHLSAPLAVLGATRLCATGRMQEPGPAWFGEEGRVLGASGLALERETDGIWRRIVEASA